MTYENEYFSTVLSCQTVLEIHVYSQGKTIAEGILNKTIELNKVTESTYYRVVAGSFTKRDNAQKVVNDLKNKNYSAFIDIYKTTKNTYYRVVAGSYSKIENAQNTVDNLRGEGFSAFIDIYKK